MCHLPRTLALLLLLLFGLSLSTLEAQEEAGPSLALQALVVDWSQGLSESELIAQVEQASPPIQLDPEIAAELRRSGFPVAVLAALEERLAPRSAAPSPDAGGYSISISFFDATLRAEGDLTEASRTIQMSNDLPRTMRRALNAPEEVKVEDLALFVLLTNPTEVPDQWQLHTELADDPRIPRHKRLLFIAGAQTIERSGLKKRFRAMLGDRSDLLELTLPESAVLELPASEPAALLFGLAGKLGSSFYLLSEPQSLELEPVHRPTEKGETSVGKPELILTWTPAKSAFQPGDFRLALKGKPAASD